MLKQLTTVNVWVRDQDSPLPLELREDVTVPELNNFRWLTVGLVGQPGVALALLPVPGVRRQSHALLAKGAMGGVCAHAELAARGVEFTQPPVEQPYGIDAGFGDPWGNRFRKVQRRELPA